ncbi:MAG: dihydrofolate reductase [Bacteroidota bacterium]
MEVVKPEIVLIAAVAEKNRVIGNDLSLPWHIPEDLKHFKSHTLGHPLVMGRRTFESLVEQFGGPLPKRRNIVLTSKGHLSGYPDIEVYESPDAMMEALKDEPIIYIGGGGKIYEHFLVGADRLELTLVEGDYEGNAFFPPFEHLVGTLFEITETRPRDGFRFITYKRIADQ